MCFIYTFKNCLQYKFVSRWDNCSIYPPVRMLPASQHCLPNPLKHHICSIEISPPPPAATGFLPLPAPHIQYLSVADWWCSLFLPIRMCHLLAVDLGQIWSSFLLSFFLQMQTQSTKRQCQYRCKREQFSFVLSRGNAKWLMLSWSIH